MVKPATPATEEDLKFLVALCVVSLCDQGHFKPSDFGNWAICFDETGEVEKKGFLGATGSQDNVQHILLNPKLTEKNLFPTIAHEMIHVTQFMKGDAENGDGINRMKWKGVEYELLPGNHPDYEKQPWEEEAYRLAPQILAHIKSVSSRSIIQIYMQFRTSEWSLKMIDDFQKS